MENGRYPARPTGNVHVGDHENGCLICNMEFAFDGGGNITNTFWLTTKDGAINTKAIDKLKEIFGWDGADPFWLEDCAGELVDIPVELTVENETFRKKDGTEGISLKIKWVDPVGGGGGNKIKNSDRNALMAKYGAKLRAVSGGTPAAKKTSTPPTPVPHRPDLAPPTPPTPKKAVFPSDANACWKKLIEAMADQPRAEVEAKWFEIIQGIHGAKSQTDYTPQDWGAVMVKLKTTFDNLPF